MCLCVCACRSSVSVCTYVHVGRPGKQFFPDFPDVFLSSSAILNFYTFDYFVMQPNTREQRVCFGQQCVTRCPSVCLFQQYSEKEDKYEEEIKVLSDKLKEVSVPLTPLPMPLVPRPPCREASGVTDSFEVMVPVCEHHECSLLI